MPHGSVTDGHAAEHAGHLADQAFQHGRRGADQEAAERGAADDDELRRLIEHERRATFHQVAAHDRSDDDQRSNDQEHRILQSSASVLASRSA